MSYADYLIEAALYVAAVIGFGGIIGGMVEGTFGNRSWLLVSLASVALVAFAVATLAYRGNS